MMLSVFRMSAMNTRSFVWMAALSLALLGDAPALAQTLSDEMETAARARCDQADVLLRAHKAKEAQTLTAGFVKDPVLSRSRHRELGLYYHGFASFLLKDYAAAARSLGLLDPFYDPAYHTHARYMLARIHHQEEERNEAALQYEAAIAEYARQKQAGLVKDPPDHIARATFYLAQLFYEDGRFSEAAARLADFGKQFPASSFVSEAQLRLGFTQVQLKQFDEAIRTLQPLVEKQPALADQALRWIGKAQLNAADPANPASQALALKTAIETFGKSAEQARKLTASDAEAKARRGETLLEMADTQQLARLPKEAVATCKLILDEKLLPERGDEVLERLATALQLAGDFVESDRVCARFLETYPRSILRSAVLFRQAESAYFMMQAAEKDLDRAKDIPRLRDEALRRCQLVLDKFPEFTHTNYVRYMRGLLLHAKGDLEKARESLEAIPAAERIGDLAFASFVLADWLIRLAPTSADDALAAGKLEEMLKTAAEGLEGFLSQHPNSPHVPEALIKLGHCQQSRAALKAMTEDRNKLLQSARDAYDAISAKFPKHALHPQAVFERGKCSAQAGSTRRGITELRRFLTERELRSDPLAPLALIHLATVYRSQEKFTQAVEALEQCRRQHEEAMLKDPARAAWVPLMHYHLGVSLMEAGKRPEARAVLELVVKQAPDSPQAMEAALRWGQCLKEEGELKAREARRRLVPGLNPEQRALIEKELDASLKNLRDAGQYLVEQAAQAAKKQPESETRARMMYDAAWSYRLAAEVEVEMARFKIQLEQWQKLRASADKIARATGQPVIAVAMPNVPLSAIAVQPSEPKMRSAYQAFFAAFPDLPLSTNARFELAELLNERNDFDQAIKLFRETFDKEPPPELTEKIRVCLGAALAAKGDPKAALAQFRAPIRNVKGPLGGQIEYRVAECLLQMGDPTEAIKVLLLFDAETVIPNQPGLTDRARLRFGQSYALLKRWDDARTAFELVTTHSGSGPWVHEARFGIGWTYQNQKQYDKAIRAYQQVTSGTTTEIAAQAQLQIGRCLLEQKKYAEAAKALLLVPAYDYPEPGALALCEAARSHFEMKEKEQGEKLLQRVQREYPGTEGAALAKNDLRPLPPKVQPNTNQAIPLPLLATVIPDAIPVADVTREGSTAAILKTPPPNRVHPAPFVALTVPDPFERRQTAKLQVVPEENPTPMTPAVKAP
jgi:TolA-binding protein